MIMIRFEKYNKFSEGETGKTVCEKFELYDVQKKLEKYKCVQVSINNSVFYCYDEFYPEYVNIDFALEQFSKLDCLWLQYFWADEIEGILFGGCNEWVFKLVPLLEREGVSVGVEGEIGRSIFGKRKGIHDKKKWKSINVSEEKYSLYKEFDWVMEILQFHRWRAINGTKDYLSRLGINVLTCTIPEFGDLSAYTMEEAYRNLNQMNITNGRIRITDSEVISHFESVYGKLWKEIRRQRVEEPMEHWLRTIYAPEYYLKNKKIYSWGKRRCYLVGPCIVEGNTIQKGMNFPQMLQDYLDELFTEKIAVMTISMPFYVVDDYLNIIKYLAIRSNDIVVCIDEISQNNIRRYSQYWDSIPNIDFKEVYDKRTDEEEWFADKPIHTSAFANKKLAEHLGNYLKRKMSHYDNDRSCLMQRGKGYLLQAEVDQIDSYIASIDTFPVDGKIGAIVMNCNPITFGHEYLIDYASKQVDYLYIFVVQEDKSYISFEDRIKLVRQYVKSSQNIKVNPSGTLILSNITMPMYFEKEIKKDIVVDAWKDVEIFAQYIAPRLGITVRFVGEENTDMITWQYNREMERTLADYDIKLVEIPRKKVEGNTISASSVRRLMNEARWEDVKKFVSEDTYRYLKCKYGNKSTMFA